MPTAEILANDITRRDLFLAPFASKKEKGAKSKPSPTLSHPKRHPKQPPKEPSKIDRRLFIAGSIAAFAGITGITRPWERFHEETLESLVAQAKNMEEQFRERDLSDRVIRKRYVDTLASAFALHTSTDLPKHDIANSVLFGETPKDFVNLLNQHSLRPEALNPNYDPDDVAATTDTGKIIINLPHPIFHLKSMTNPIYPRGWNPLKSLRRILSHEFNHFITPIITDDELLNATDLDEKFTDRRVAGFSIRAFHPNGSSVAINVAIDEAAVELQAANFSDLLSPSLEIQYFSVYGEDIAGIALRLSNLTQKAGIGLRQLSSLNRSSNLKEFLLLLAEKAKISSQATFAQRLEYGFKVCDALINNDQMSLQDFINRATLIK